MAGLIRAHSDQASHVTSAQNTNPAMALASFENAEAVSSRLFMGLLVTCPADDARRDAYCPKRRCLVTAS
jgi:hypothetical protein